jgi:hypothetical protein
LKKPKAKKIGKAALIFVGAIVLLFLIAIGVLLGWAAETVGRQVVYMEKKPSASDYVEVRTRVISSDLNKKSIVVRMVIVPEGGLADNRPDTDLLAQPLTVYVSPGTTDQNRTYLPGAYMSPMDITLDTEGEAELYPWDDHEATFTVYVVRPVPGGEPVPVTTRVRFEGSEPGLTLRVKVDKKIGGAKAKITILADRSTVTKAVVWFSIALIWVLAGTVTVMALLVLRGRKLEMVMFPFAGTILFSMVAFRTALPGAPPIGALSDYMGAFWGYALVTLSLVAFTVTWARRKDQ